jgi:DNA phosphorothioation-dependent restriction protein DptG
MKYRFEIHNYFDQRDGLEKEIPLLFIENSEKYGDYFQTEVSNLSFDYLEEIVLSLEKVIRGDLEQYEFGYELYCINCRKENSQVIDTFNEWKTIVDLPTQSIYELIRDWKCFLEQYNSSE